MKNWFLSMFQKVARLVMVLVLVGLLAGLVVLVAAAQGTEPPATPDPLAEISKLASFLVISFGGAAGLITVLVNLGKQGGLVTPDGVDNWVTGLGLFGILALWAVKTFAPQVDLMAFDAFAKALTSGLIAATPLLVAVLKYLAGKIHDQIRGVSLFKLGVGYSYSAQKKR